MEKLLHFIGVESESKEISERVSKNAGHILGLAIAFITLGVLTIISFQQEINLYPVSTLIEGYLVGIFTYKAIKWYKKTSLLSTLPYILFILLFSYLFVTHFQMALNF
ncbi:hypothetical protein [Facklamia sp. 7083-14-GEN3]|uniref:hypothetical protein n=1 Tax=Facklamia sp. 7083-14-GEN3 TaxID=2973478 RepID=UPI00215B9126|nr:hypothetical protein [Facklamia sp. 7083-14-GEN3]MCR8968472.1 hypothetical protein [Facklamia sp. 7083-14-GEN3]